MVLNGTPIIDYEGRVVGGGPGYSSLAAELARGRTFSAQVSAAQVLRPTPQPAASTPSGAPSAPVTGVAPAHAPSVSAAAPPALAEPAPAPDCLLARAELSPLACPPGPLVAPGGLAAGATGSLGLVDLAGAPGLGLQVQVQGLRPLPAAQAQYALWLLHDLVVPADLAPEDLALLPRGPLGTGNLAGSAFTLDGQPVAQGQLPNTVTVAIQAGMFTPDVSGVWDGRFDWGEALGWTLSPATALGAAAAHLGPSSFLPVPTGVARAILADVFLRRASRFVHLPLHSAFPQRLLAATQEALATWDVDRSGSISSSDVAATGRSDAFIEPLAFNRAVITLEPIAGRQTPLLLPTVQTCALAGSLIPCQA